MVMRVMLIGLLVAGTVAMLETPVDAQRHCACWACLFFTLPSQLEELVGEVQKHEGGQVWILGYTGVGSSSDYDRLSRTRIDVQEMLIQRGLPPDIIHELILEGRAPRVSMQKGQEVIVAWPQSEPKKQPCGPGARP